MSAIGSSLVTFFGIKKNIVVQACCGHFPLLCHVFQELHDFSASFLSPSPAELWDESPCRRFLYSQIFSLFDGRFGPGVFGPSVFLGPSQTKFVWMFILARLGVLGACLGVPGCEGPRGRGPRLYFFTFILFVDVFFVLLFYQKC